MSNRCPLCGKIITPDIDDRWLPFCSKRCQLVDLGDWLNENHRIASDDDEIWNLNKDDDGITH